MTGKPHPNERAPFKTGIDRPGLQCRISDYYSDGSLSEAFFSPTEHIVHMGLHARVARARGGFCDGMKSDRVEHLGRIVFVPAHHAFRAQSPPGVGTSLKCMFDISQVPDLERIWTKFSPAKLAAALDVRNPVILRCVKIVVQEIEEPGFASELMIESTCGTLAVALMRHFCEIDEPARLKNGGLAPWRMKRIHDLLIQSDRAPTLAEFASVCQLNEQYLTRAFKQETGRSLGSYARSFMIDTARRLLTEGDEPIARIAERLGFASAASFSAAFHKSNGLTPREFRLSYSSAKHAWNKS